MINITKQVDMSLDVFFIQSLISADVNKYSSTHFQKHCHYKPNQSLKNYKVAYLLPGFFFKITILFP